MQNKKSTFGREILIGLFITIFGGIIVVLFDDLLSGNEKGPSNSINSSHSSNQITIQSQQNIEGTGNVVTTEYIGTKNIVQNDYPPANISSSPIVKNQGINIGKVENSGNLSIGQSGGTVNQTTIITKPLERYLTETEKEKILSRIPKGFKVEIRYPQGQEPEYFSEQIERFLNNSDRISLRIRQADILPDGKENFSIKPYPGQPGVMILTIYPQK